MKKCTKFPFLYDEKQGRFNREKDGGGGLFEKSEEIFSDGKHVATACEQIKDFKKWRSFESSKGELLIGQMGFRPRA